MTYRLNIGILLLAIFTLSLAVQANPAREKMDIYLLTELKRLGYISAVEAEDFGILKRLVLAEELYDRRFDLAVFGDMEFIRRSGIPIHSTFSNFVTTRISLAELHGLLHNPEIQRIEKGTTFDILLDKSVDDIRADLVRRGLVTETPLTGRGVIIGVIDTGIDVFHPDFQVPGEIPTTRIVSIWDKTLKPEQGERPPAGFTRGVEYTRDQINDAIAGRVEGYIRSADIHGHGTHVAGIAGGNAVLSDGLYYGVAPEAEFIIVRVPPQQIEEIWIVDGLYYIFGKAQELGKPAVINLSLGSHRGAHDGTALSEVVINELTKFEGRIVVVAAGNSGESRIHTGGKILVGETTEFTILIRPYTPDPREENRVVSMLWHDGGPGANFRVQSPRGFVVQTTRADTLESPDGVIRIASGGPNLKGAYFFLLEITEGNNRSYPQPGGWIVRFQPLTGRGEVRFNNWITTSTIGLVTVSPHSGREYTLTIPGTAENAITVGSHITKDRWVDAAGNWQETSKSVGALSDFSSGGPTRDGRLKPDITAPGEVVASAMSTTATIPLQVRVAGGGYYVARGTSMAAPHVTGLIALLFQVNPYLSAEDIVSILQRTGRQDTYTSQLPNYEWGYGKLDAAAAVLLAPQYLAIPTKYVLSQNYPNPFNAGTRFHFRLPHDTNVIIEVYDILGRRVSVIVDEYRRAGTYFESFVPTNMSTGIYFLHMRAGGFTETKKMLYVR